MTSVLFDGYTMDAVLALPKADFEALILRDEPLVFSVGSASIIGQFKVAQRTLVVELGHIDGGGEGALPAIASLASRLATRDQLEAIEWRVHAVHCARPNLKLRRVLERRGFVITDIFGVGECYWRRVSVGGMAAAESPGYSGGAPENTALYVT